MIRTDEIADDAAPRPCGRHDGRFARAGPLRMANGVSTGATLTESGRCRTASGHVYTSGVFSDTAAKDFRPEVDNLL
ncbi:hypothetical protein [Paraburkholderia lycopersici]|uniref:hypothetical protein n=1 Tax=Paraburkholderia lycopersici TaxID=416944 RepID=UPI001160EE68|nr:hypothetical protein [Paraburkholderia lycopersici]